MPYTRKEPQPIISVDEEGNYSPPGAGAAAGGLNDAPATSGTGGNWTIPSLLRGILNALVTVVVGRIDITNFSTRTIDVKGALGDNVILAAPAAGKRHFIYAGTLQPAADVTITFKSNGVNIYHPIKLKADDLFDLAELAELVQPRLYGAVDNTIVMNLSVATNVNYTIYSREG